MGYITTKPEGERVRGGTGQPRKCLARIGSEEEAKRAATSLGILQKWIEGYWTFLKDNLFVYGYFEQYWRSRATRIESSSRKPRRATPRDPRRATQDSSCV